MLEHARLKRAIANADDTLQKIKAKYAVVEPYRGVKMYLVFSSPLGQTAINGSIETILEQFPSMIEDDDIKAAAMAVYGKLRGLRQAQKNAKTLDDGKNDIQKLSQMLESFTSKLSYRDDVNIEIRFESLKYEFIWELQHDDLVDRELTPQSRASIRIVVGTVGRLSNQ